MRDLNVGNARGDAILHAICSFAPAVEDLNPAQKAALTQVVFERPGLEASIANGEIGSLAGLYAELNGERDDINREVLGALTSAGTRVQYHEGR